MSPSIGKVSKGKTAATVAQPWFPEPRMDVREGLPEERRKDTFVMIPVFYILA